MPWRNVLDEVDDTIAPCPRYGCSERWDAPADLSDRAAGFQLVIKIVNHVLIAHDDPILAGYVCLAFAESYDHVEILKRPVWALGELLRKRFAEEDGRG